MRKLILKAVPIMLVIGFIISIIEQFVDLSANTLIITDNIEHIFTYYCTALVIFCYVLKKDESNSIFKIGFGLIVISMLLTLVRNVLPIDLSLEVNNIIYKVNKTIQFIITCLKYIGVLTIIETTDEKATLAKTGANLFCIIYCLIHIAILWIGSEPLSLMSKLSYLANDGINLFAITFLALKLLSEDEADNIRNYQQEKNPDLAKTTGLNYQNEVQQSVQQINQQPAPQPMPAPPVPPTPQPMPAPPTTPMPQPMPAPTQPVQTPTQL